MTTSTAVKSLALGDKAPDFGDLKGADGKTYRMSSFDDKPVLAFVFISNGCPTVRVYDDRLIGLQRAYEDRGLQVVALNSNNPYLSPADAYTEMVKRLNESGYNFPYLKDEDGSVARSYGAISTPHAFVFDRDRKLRYRGRVDDSRDPSKITSHDLENALVAVLEGRAVEVPDTQSFGCAIVR
jgi:peroxiredoxin